MSIQLGNRTPLLPPSTIRSFLSEKLKLDLLFPENSPHTDQSFKAESDINTIMARYQSTGEMPLINQSYPQYLDVTQQDFQEHMNVIAGANQMFSQLPSKIRDRFGNDPAAFLGFVSDADNRSEMARMGLFTPEATRAILNPPAPSQDASAASQPAAD